MASIKHIVSDISKYSSLVNKETGKSKLLTIVDMAISGLRYGASPANYWKFDFSGKSAKYRSSFITNRVSSKLIQKYNAEELIPSFEDKVSFMEQFKAYTKRDFIAYPECSEAEYSQFVRNNPKFIAKPVNGSQGQGIIVFDCAPSFSFISERWGGGRYILEAFLPQHEELNAFYDKSVNCIRVITILKDDTVNLLVANITFGEEYEIANASYGGITCEIDVDSGIIISDGGQYGHKLYTEHPFSGKKFKDCRIPYWDELKKLLNDACRVVPQIAYVGWDLAITPDGPVIIEGNTSPGYTYFQIPQLLSGNSGVMEKYRPFL